MARRWRTLIAVALAIIFVDQWSKLLAVKHLTPGILSEHQADTAQDPRAMSPEEREEVLESLGPFTQLRYFYGGARSPCDARGARCPRVRVIGGFWDWNYAENPGAAWSMFAGSHASFRLPFLIGVSLIAILFIIGFMRKLSDSQSMLILALSLICGGAIGNLIDRARLGYVIDFIEWYVGSMRWPTFNVADSAISTGVALIALNMLLDLRAKKTADAAENEPLASSSG